MNASGGTGPNVLFGNVRVFDGMSASLSGPSNVLVRGNTIAAVSAQPIPAAPGEERAEIDGTGRVLMPGLIDAHYHAVFATLSPAVLLAADLGYIRIQAAVGATSQNAALLALSGERNPYPGRLGVIEEGALADLLLVNGNPLDDLDLISTPATSLAVIMKDGKIHKNLLGPALAAVRSR